MKILLCGDVHIDTENIKDVFQRAIYNDCGMIIVLGDFCYFPHLKRGKAFLEEIQKLIKDTGILLYFVKGNHDNHEILSKYKEITELHPGIFFLPNLVRFVIGKISFCPVGGAYSIDQLKRQRFINYWDNETISNEDVRNSKDVRADIVLSHDCPISVNIDYYLDFKRDPNTFLNRRMLQECVDNIKPKYLFHGHYHNRIIGEGTHPEGTFVSVGLAANKNNLKDQLFVLDTSKELDHILEQI